METTQDPVALAPPPSRSEVDRLMTDAFDDLRDMASRFLSREGAGHTLQPTDLVNESFLKLADQTRILWQGRSHFLAASARTMRRVLVDHARTKHRQKRGGRGRIRFELRDHHAISTDRPDEILFVDEVLERLERLDSTDAKILEYRLFGGLDLCEIGEVLGLSSRTIERHFAMVRAWFLKEVHGRDA